MSKGPTRVLVLSNEIFGGFFYAASAKPCFMLNASFVHEKQRNKVGTKTRIWGTIVLSFSLKLSAKLLGTFKVKKLDDNNCSVVHPITDFPRKDALMVVTSTRFNFVSEEIQC